MNEDDLRLIRDTVREFVAKNSAEIKRSEDSGLSQNLKSALAKLGFLGAKFPADVGGAELPQDGYLVLLNEMAKSSPSISVLVTVLNSLFYPLARDSEKGVLSEICQGKSNASVAYSQLINPYINDRRVTVSERRVQGTDHHVINNDCNVSAILGAEPDSKVYLIMDGIASSSRQKRLGLNGLGFGSIEYDTDRFEVLAEQGVTLFAKILDSIDGEIAAVTLGIAEGALSKAAEYAEQRKAFEKFLKDYGPIGGTLGALKSEIGYLTRLALQQNAVQSGELLAVKSRALALCERATNFSIQVFGGYGYFEEFEVEKFYRDLAVIESLFVQETRDRERLATLVFGSRSGYL